MLLNSTVAILPIPLDELSLEAFCRNWGVTELDLFGSVLRNDFGPGSDIDVLVTLSLDRRPTLFTLTTMEDELGTILHRRVDLLLRQSLDQDRNHIRRQHILARCVPLYIAEWLI